MAALVVAAGPIDSAAQGTASQIYKDSSAGVVFIKTESGAGSGFLVSKDGLIATCYHVIDGAKSVGVKTLSGDIYDDVYLVAKDERKDIALLKINGFDLKSLELGNSNEISPGEKLVVLGNPLGKEQLQVSVTDGVVSGIRDLEEGYKVIQMSAPISPGNSGGPVFSESGKVVGIAAFKLRGGENLNFAIPINYLRGMLSAPTGPPLARWKPGQSGDGVFSEKAPGRLSGRWKSSSGNFFAIKEDGKRFVVLNLSYPNFTYDLKWMDDLVVGVVYGNGRDGFVIKAIDDDRLVIANFKYKNSDADSKTLEKARKAINDPSNIWIRID